MTLETQSLARDFDAIAFSVSFEWDYTNLLTMLRLAGVPLRAEARTAHDPLVIVGGAVTFVNPEPLALFADVIAAGEGEELVPALVERCVKGGDRKDLLSLLLQNAGSISRRSTRRLRRRRLYRALRPASTAPGLQRWSARPRLPSTAAVEPPCTSIFTPDTEFGSRFLVEVVRGCANLCRFCWAGYNYLPVRAFPADRILERAQGSARTLEATPVSSRSRCATIPKSIGCSQAWPTWATPSARHPSVSTISPRSIVRRLRQSGEKTLTIAPETGSDRLRRVINKTVTNDEILDRAELIFANGIENLKLYYMVGLPTETDEDLVAIRDLTLQLRDIMLKHAREQDRSAASSRASIRWFRNRRRPISGCPMEDPGVIEARSAAAARPDIRSRQRVLQHQVRASFLLPGPCCRSAIAAWHPPSSGRSQRRRLAPAVADVGIDADFYVFRDRTKDAVLPWSIIDGGHEGVVLPQSELEKSYAAEWTLPPKRAAENAKLLEIG